MLLVETIMSKGRIVESDRSKLPKGVLMRGVWPVCNINELNANNRRYKKNVWEKVLGNESIMEKMKKRTLYGQAEHPEKTQSDLQLTSHIITNTFFEKVNEDGQEKEKLFQAIDILDTPCGRIVNTLMEAGCQVGVSTRAEGDLEEVEEGGNKFQDVVAESYNYVTTDFTADPSTYGTVPMRVEKNLVKEIVSGYKKAKDGKQHISKQFATQLLESMKSKEAKKALKDIKEYRGGYEPGDTVYIEGDGKVKIRDVDLEGDEDIYTVEDSRGNVFKIKADELVSRPDESKGLSTEQLINRELVKIGADMVVREGKYNLEKNDKLYELTKPHQGMIVGIDEAAITVQLDNGTVITMDSTRLSGDNVEIVLPPEQMPDTGADIEAEELEGSAENEEEIQPSEGEEETTQEPGNTGMGMPAIEDEEEREYESKELEEGLTQYQDNLIFIKPSSFKDGWDVLKGMRGRGQVTVIFTFESEEEAMKAGEGIAAAIGGKFMGKTDPRREEFGSPEAQESTEVDEAKMGVDYVKSMKAAVKTATQALKDKDYEGAAKALEDVADDAGDAAKAAKKMKRENDRKEEAEKEKSETDEKKVTEDEDEIDTQVRGDKEVAEQNEKNQCEECGAELPDDPGESEIVKCPKCGYMNRYLRPSEKYESYKVTVKEGKPFKVIKILKQLGVKEISESTKNPKEITFKVGGELKDKVLERIQKDFGKLSGIEMVEEKKIKEGLESHVEQALEDAGVSHQHWEWAGSEVEGQSAIKVDGPEAAHDIIRALAKSGEFGPTYYERSYVFFMPMKGMFGESKVTESYEDMVNYLEARLKGKDAKEIKKFGNLIKSKILKETISTTAKEMRELKIKEAATRAEKDKALELLEETESKLTRAITDSSLETKILTEKVKKSRLTENDVNALCFKLEEKVAVIRSLTNEVKMASDKVKQVKEKYERDKEEFVELSIKELEESKKNLEEKYKQELVKEYIKLKVKHSGLKIHESSRALLEKCTDVESVDEIFEQVRDAMRRGALNPGPINEVHVTEESKSTGLGTFANSVKSALKGMNE